MQKAIEIAPFLSQAGTKIHYLVIAMDAIRELARLPLISTTTINVGLVAIAALLAASKPFRSFCFRHMPTSSSSAVAQVALPAMLLACTVILMLSRRDVSCILLAIGFALQLSSVVVNLRNRRRGPIVCPPCAPTGAIQ